MEAAMAIPDSSPFLCFISTSQIKYSGFSRVMHTMSHVTESQKVRRKSFEFHRLCCLRILLAGWASSESPRTLAASRFRGYIRGYGQQFARADRFEPNQRSACAAQRVRHDLDRGRR